MDDVLLAGRNMVKLEMAKGKLMTRFEMPDMGEVSMCWVCKSPMISKQDRSSSPRRTCTRGLLVKYGMQDCRPLETPGCGKELSVMQPEDRVISICCR